MRFLLVIGTVALIADLHVTGSRWTWSWHSFASGLATLRATRVRRRAQRDLARLPDYLLSDIGVTRSDLRPVRSWFPDTLFNGNPDIWARGWIDGGRPL